MIFNWAPTQWSMIYTADIIFFVTHNNPLKRVWLFSLSTFYRHRKGEKRRSLYLTWFLLQTLQWLAALPLEQIPSSAWKASIWTPFLSVTLIHSLCCVPHCSRSECLACMGSCSHPPGLASLSWSVLLHLLSPDLVFVSFIWLIPTHPWKLQSWLLQKPS